MVRDNGNLFFLFSLMFQANYDGNKPMVPIRMLFSKIMKGSERYYNKLAENLMVNAIIINH